MGIERTTVWRNIGAMKNKTVLRRVGGDRNGYWEVLFDIKNAEQKGSFGGAIVK